MPPTIAYVAQGKLYLLRPGAEAALIESPFVDELIARTERDRARNEWKQSGMGWNLTAANRFGLPNAAPADVRRVRFTGVARGPADDVIYLLDTDTVGGIFQYDLKDGYERRLHHRNQFRASDVHCHPASGRLILSTAGDAATTHLAVTDAEGRKLRTVTEGDAVDQSPSWTGEGQRIVYQSAGLARDAMGFVAGQSPFALYTLDLSDGSGGLLLEDAAHDLLLPRRTADGTLYFIRRPHVARPGKPSLWRVALDVLLFPFRLVRAVVHFLNFFSLMFSQKPLLTSGGPPTKGPDPKFLLLWGRVIQADKLLKNNSGDGAPVVPGDWHLVRRAPDGAETVLARGVASYDIAADGGLVFTDGSTLRALAADGGVTTLGTGRLVERIVAL